MNSLGGLNYDAKLAAEDYRSNRNLIEKEILTRFLLQSGATANANPAIGIVDVINPSQISPTEVSRPFLVQVSPVNPLRVDVTAGIAVTLTGAVIESPALATFELSRTQAGDINVLFLENEIIPAGEQRLNDYQEVLYPQEVQNPNMMKSALLQDFQNTALFPALRLENVVVVAVIAVVAAQDNTLELQIDMSKVVYGFNRPWFSVRDAEHRSHVGTGQITETNPHGTSYNDLTVAGSVGLFQGLLETGMVVSRDRQINKMTGSFFCTEQIPTTRIKTDTLGTMTRGSIYGGTGAKYVELLSFPVRLGSVYQTAHKSNSIAAELVPGSNVLVLGPSEPLDEAMTVEYNEARALMPSVNVSSNVLQVGQPDEGEVIVVDGKTVDVMPDNTIDMDGTGPYPRKYRVFMLGDRSLTVFPQVLTQSIRLDAIGTSLQTPMFEMKAPARLGLGLTRATSVSGMVLEIQFVGLDEGGAQVSETVRIANADGYADETLPSTNYDSPQQIYYTDTVFGRLDTFQVVARVSDGPLSEIQVWAEIEPGTATTANDLPAAVSISWNGQGIQKLEDIRLVSKGYFKPDHIATTALGALALDSARLLSQLLSSTLISGQSTHIMTEDFEDLRYFDTVKGLTAPIAASGKIVIGNNALIQANDQITINTGKTLVATSGVANAAVGQFQINGDLAVTRQNMLDAINNTTFNSGVTGQFFGSNQISLTFNQPGVAGNSVNVIATLADSGSIQVEGFSGGYGSVSECYMDRNRIGLHSTRIPQDSDLNAYGYQFRNRYRSRALSTPSGSYSKVSIVLHGQDVAFGRSVRVRGSAVARPDEWLAWQIATVAVPGVENVFIVQLPVACHKIQIELYGKARACSVFRLVPN